MKTESGILMNQFDLMEENQMLKIENEQLKERLEELREAAEKQIPIRPYIVDDEYKGEYCICSNCYEVIGYIDDYKLKQCQKTYCQNCGQKIELSEVAK